MRPNPIALAVEVGQACGGAIGRTMLPDLVCTHLLLATKRLVYDDNQDARVRLNNLIYMPPGTKKTGTLGRFLKLAKAINHLDGDEAPRPEGTLPSDRLPTYIEEGGSVTMQFLKGSVADDGSFPIPPMAEVDYFILPEFMRPFGSSNYDEISSEFQVLFEEGRVKVGLSRGSKASQAERDKTAEWVKLNADPKIFRYNRKTGGYNYVVHCSTIGVTANIDRQMRTKMEKSGLLSRFLLQEPRMSNDGLMGFMRKPSVRDRHASESELSSMLVDIFNTEFLSVNYPSTGWLDGLAYRDLFEAIEATMKSANLDARDVINKMGGLRFYNTTAQLLTAHAIGRIVASRQPGDRSPVESIEYEIEDARFAVERLMQFVRNLDDDYNNGDLKSRKPANDASVQYLGGFMEWQASLPPKSPDATISGLVPKRLFTKYMTTVATLKADPNKRPSRKTADNCFGQLCSARIISQTEGERRGHVLEQSVFEDWAKAADVDAVYMRDPYGYRDIDPEIGRIRHRGHDDDVEDA